MKAKFKRDFRNPMVYWLIVLAVVLWGACQFMGIWYGDWLRAFLCSLSMLAPLFIACTPYYIADTGNLNGIIQISFITRIEQLRKGGYRIFYTWMENGKERSSCFYPKEGQLFIDKLLEINPNIKLN